VFVVVKTAMPRTVSGSKALPSFEEEQPAAARRSKRENKKALFIVLPPDFEK
jgi:hypothetical protein